jgi:hypothetical protein
MTSKVYKSALGKRVDLGALILKNETERAVSNLNVNARGDIIDNMNRPITSRGQQVRNQYRQTNLNHDPVTDRTTGRTTQEESEE